MWKHWVLDASAGCTDGLFCFCPIEGDVYSDGWQLITGMNFLSEGPPNGVELVAIIHEGGQEAVETFCQKYAKDLEALRRRIHEIQGAENQENQADSAEDKENQTDKAGSG